MKWRLLVMFYPFDFGERYSEPYFTEPLYKYSKKLIMVTVNKNIKQISECS